MKEKKTFLGLDLGEKTLGVAISEFGIIACNLKTIYFSPYKYEELWKPLEKIIKNFKVKIVVLGFPKHMNNDLGIKAQISLYFKKKMNFLFNSVQVVLWDERLSTKQSIQILLQNKRNRKKRLKLKNEISAVVILQNFLNYYQNNYYIGKE
ncbi:putative Holliday junction resolvase [Candidatus Phytoplasma oryzae]|uniref:Putative pre-16S rRNA nuclease n=1 Tax=Candidatus Phytoplasma oryzae TaxID=203274 RepID=A0A139JQS8_9MOLU|nr:Holliday junction resolvase RuvX [Candidatus Phytoplasma oryzae]KXT29322.1 putative Holliday junction resolvase [Candidatus Phytoplasma oryzae]RAM57877.1 Holliday junction resolvase [Candidatus Phytoplasma oryzae]